MHEYEIRILSAGHTTAVVEEIHLHDHGAVRSARKFALGKPFEVWRGQDCIFKTDSARMQARRTYAASLNREIF